MKCKVCNAELSEGQAFCSYCGTKVEAEPVAEETVEASVQEQPATQEAPVYEVQQPAAQTVPVYNPPKPEENEKSPADGQALAGLILGICSLLLCCIGLPSGIIGIIMSAKGLKSKTRKGMAIPGLILSILAVINFFSFWIGFAGGLTGEIDSYYDYINMLLSSLPF